MADVESPGAAPRIFINYRREQDPGSAGRLYDYLSGRFGAANIFIDVDNIEPGQDFVRVLNEAVGRCDALIAVIGPEWLEAKQADGTPRLSDPNDFVRLEIEAALRRDVRVIPVLVNGAAMPNAQRLPGSLAALSRHQALELTHQRWRFDVGRLAEVLERLPAATPPPLTDHRPARSGWKPRPVAIVGAAVLLVVAAVVVAVVRSDTGDGGSRRGPGATSPSSAGTTTTNLTREATGFADIRRHFTIAQSDSCRQTPASTNKVELVCHTGAFQVSFAKWSSATAMQAWTDMQERTYNATSQPWHREEAPSIYVGLIMEYSDTNGPYIYWTYDSQLLSVRAVHDQRDTTALHELWRQNQVGFTA